MRASAHRAVKRSIDVVVAVVVLALGWPAMVATAVAIRVAMGRPVLFSQARPGLNGEPFTVIKFRTMRQGEGSDAERLTAVGRFIRSTSLDELPQMWNVLKGDMSLVGPRPWLMQYLPLYSERQAKRHLVRPGITGLAQVNGRNSASWEERIELDVQYVENQSIAMDLQILAQTVRNVVRRTGISAEGAATMPVFTGSPSAEAA